MDTKDIMRIQCVSCVYPMRVSWVWIHTRYTLDTQSIQSTIHTNDTDPPNREWIHGGYNNDTEVVTRIDTRCKTGVITRYTRWIHERYKHDTQCMLCTRYTIDTCSIRTRYTFDTRQISPHIYTAVMKHVRTSGQVVRMPD